MRPNPVRPSRSHNGLLLTAVLVTLALPLIWVGYQEWTQPAFPNLNEWDLDRVEQHLHDQGLGLRRVEAAANLRMVPSMLLTRTDKDWAQLDRVPKDRRRISEWQGTVYCEKWSDAEGQQIHAALWQDCCLLAGPYLFFGDRAILAEIDQALRVPARPAQGRPQPGDLQPLLST